MTQDNSEVEGLAHNQEVVGEADASRPPTPATNLLELDDTPLEGGVCDMEGGCESCQ